MFIDLSNPFVVAGLLIAMLPYLFGSMGMQAVEEQVGCSNCVEDSLKKFLEL